MSRRFYSLLCATICLSNPACSFGDNFGDWQSMAQDWQYALEHRNRQPNPAARPVPTAQPAPAVAGTLGVGNGAGASLPMGGGVSASGVPTIVGAQAPIVRPGQ